MNEVAYLSPALNLPNSRGALAVIVSSSLDYSMLLYLFSMVEIVDWAEPLRLKQQLRRGDPITAFRDSHRTQLIRFLPVKAWFGWPNDNVVIGIGELN
jgi:hypothetical protein